MQRRSLDIIFSAGGAAIAVLLLVIAVVFTSEASFANQYVADQLAAQNIFFKPAADLTEEEAQAPCLVKYGAGDEVARQMTTGAQAECYANNFIGLHLRTATGGLSYAELGGPQREAREKVTEAQENNDPALPELQAALDEINAQRDTAFRGETLRGLLLTTYGFSILGEKAGLAGNVAFVAAGLMALLSIAGFVHAFRTPKSVPFAPVVREGVKV